MSEKNIFNFYTSLLLLGSITDFEQEFRNLGSDLKWNEVIKEYEGVIPISGDGLTLQKMTFSKYLQSCSEYQSSKLVNNIDETIENAPIDNREVITKEIEKKLNRYLERIGDSKHLKNYPFFKSDLQQVKEKIKPYSPRASQSENHHKPLTWLGDDKTLCTLFIAISKAKAKRGKRYLDVDDDTLNEFIWRNFARKDGSTINRGTISTYLRLEQISSHILEEIIEVLQQWIKEKL